MCNAHILADDILLVVMEAFRATSIAFTSAYQNYMSVSYVP
jgi:hypothetical protein